MSFKTVVTIFQPYVPVYRVSFFERLKRSLASEDIELQLVAGSAHGSQAARGDAVTLPWVTPYVPKAIRLRQHTVSLSTGRDHWKNSALVVLPLIATNLEPYAALLLPGRPRVILWGHIDSYVGPPNAIDRAIESWMVRRADGVFAYTENGAELAVKWGARPEKVTALNNTLDTAELETFLRLAELDENHVSATAVPTFAYLGGLDSSKRIDILSAALDLLYQRGSDVRVIVGGNGQDSRLLDIAVSRGQVEMRGYVDTAEKARILSASVAILCPGRVGLLAVDALVARKPILSVDWPYHAPEAEYLEQGVSVHFSDESADSYANLIESFLREHPSQKEAWRYPTIEDMVTRFKRGILSALETKR